MIKPSPDIRVYDNNIAKNKNFFTGGINHKDLMMDPLIKGHAMIIWIKIPKWLESEFPGFQAMTQKNFLGLDGISDIELQTQAYAYGFNSNEYHVAAGVTKGNTSFTLRHQEFSGSPIKNMYQYWVSSISDPETGIATYARKHGLDYAAKNHTGEFMYIVTRPDVNNVDKNNIEFAAYFTHVMPTKIPLSHFNYSQGDKSLAEIDMPFVASMHISAKVDSYARELLRTSYSFVVEGMFDPQNSDIAGSTTADFEASLLDYGISGSGLGDI